MRSTRSLLAFLSISAITHPNAYAQSTTNPTKRAELALSALQIWYNVGTGLWNTCGWWNSANVMTMIGNLAKHDPQNAKVQDLAKRIFANTIVQAPAKNPDPGAESRPLQRRDNETMYQLFNTSTSGYEKSVASNGEYITTYPLDWAKPSGAYIDIKTLPIFQALDADQSPIQSTAAPPNPKDWLDGYYDDDLWWALAWISAYDITKNIQYLQLAEGIFTAVAAKAWPTRCYNGGIFWRSQHDYMNAIANELFLSTAAHLANRAQNKGFYVEWAQRELEWFLKTGMINDEGTINDGLTEDCENDGKVNDISSTAVKTRREC